MTGRAAKTGLILAMSLLCASAPGRAAADEKDPLARARLLYNQRKFEDAIAAADQSRSAPGRADSANLIAARAYLELYRETGEVENLSNGHDRLRVVDPAHLGLRERAELSVGFGEALFFDGNVGAAAEVFDLALARPDGLGVDARERVLDWWATAIDREARSRPELDRQALYQRVRDRMQREIVAHPENTTADYWLVAATLGQGDWQAAWDAAQAAWVRAPLAGARGASLRTDLDRLVIGGIAVERAKSSAQPAEAVRADWERFKERWQK